MNSCTAGVVAAEVSAAVEEVGAAVGAAVSAVPEALHPANMVSIIITDRTREITFFIIKYSFLKLK